jgi:hypothetical protein
MWGISGDVGEIYRKQQSDALKDQLLQQEMAQRIKAFEAEQEYRKQQVEERAADRRMDANRLGLEEMRMSRQQMDEDEKRTQRESARRAGANLQGLIPLLQPGTPEARQEILGQYARINPEEAAAKMLELTAEQKAAQDLKNLGQQREIIESTAARFRPPPGGAPDYEWVNRGGTPTQIVKGRTQPGDVPYTPPARTRTEMTPSQSFNATRQLRNDFVRETKSASTMRQQLNLMEQALAATKAGNKAAGNQGVLVTFQKILDPTSVVRESEYARSASGQSLLSRMEGALQRLAVGGAGVPDDELEKFVDLARQFTQSQAEFAATTKEQIEGVAEEYGINSKNITRDFAPAGTGQGQGTGGGMPTYQDYLNRRKKPGG